MPKKEEVQEEVTKESTKLVAVTFLKGYSLYNKGETAGFTSKKAELLIKNKVAKKA